MDKENKPLPMNGQELNNPDESQVLQDVSGAPVEIEITVAAPEDALQDQKVAVQDDALSELHTDDDGSIVEKKLMNEFKVSQENRDKAVNALIGLGNVPPNEIPPTLKAARKEIKKLMSKNSKLARQNHLYHDIRMQAEKASAEFTQELNKMRVQLSERSTELITLRTETSENLIELQGQLAEERMRALAIDRTLSATQIELREANRSLTRMTSRHTESENRVASLHSEIERHIASKQGLREECSQVRTKTSGLISQLKSDKGELSDALGRAKDTIRKLTSELKESDSKLKSRTSDRETLTKQVETLQVSLNSVNLARDKEKTKQLIVQNRMESKKVCLEANKVHKLATDAALKVQVDKERLANRTSEKMKQLDNVAAHKANLKKAAAAQESKRVSDLAAEQARKKLAGEPLTPTAFPVRDDNNEVASLAASAVADHNASVVADNRPPPPPPAAAPPPPPPPPPPTDMATVLQSLNQFTAVLRQTGNLSSLVPKETMTKKEKKKKKRKKKGEEQSVDPLQQTLTQMPSMKKKKENNENEKENNDANVVTPALHRKVFRPLEGKEQEEQKEQAVPEEVKESSANVDVSQLTETIKEYYEDSPIKLALDMDGSETEIANSSDEEEEDLLIESSDDDSSAQEKKELDEIFATGCSPASD